MKPAAHRPEGRAANCGVGAFPSAAGSLLSAWAVRPTALLKNLLTMGRPRLGTPPTRTLPLFAREGSPIPRPQNRGSREDIREAFGLIVTMGVIFGLTGVLWNHVNILYLPVMLVLAVAFSSYLGGTRQGMLSAGLAWVFLSFYLFAANPNIQDWIANWLIWTVVLPSVALLTGYLHHRAREKEFQPWKGDLAPFRIAAESVLDMGVILLDREGQVSAWNTGAQRLFGWSLAEMKGQQLARCCSPNAIVNGTCQEALKEAADRGRFEGEWDCLRKDGSRFQARVAVVGLRDERGVVSGYTVSAHDLSERQEAASALLRRAHQQVAVAALSQAALAGAEWHILMDHAVTFIMQTWAVDFCEILELQPDGRSLVMRAGAGWKAGCLGQIVARTGSGSILSYALESPEPVITRDLNELTRFTIPDIFTEHGARSSLLVGIPARQRSTGLIGVQSRRSGEFSEDDLSFMHAVAGVLSSARARRLAEAEAAKLSAFPQYNPNPVFDFGPDGGLSYFNEAASRLAVAAKMNHASQILPPDCERLVRECLASEANRLGVESTVSNRTIQWSFYTIPDIGRVHVYAADVTERVSLEQQLRQSQKMEAIGRLAAGVAHDFNNVLTIMQGYACRLLTSEAPQASREDARQILNATDRAASLTRQLLTFSRKQPLQPRLLDLRAVATQMSQMLERLIGENIRLTVKNPDTLPAVSADVGMVEQVLLNLVVNARDAMPHGGELLVETSAVTVGEAQVRQRTDARAGEFVCLDVCDNGCGMDTATLGRIFEPFFTTKGPDKGTGLGLATTYGIVRQHQGWIEVDSKPGKGAKFSVYLPAVDGQPERLEEEAHPGAPPRPGTETVLLVEDEPLLRDLAKAALEGSGYKVLLAATALEAMLLWQRHKDSVDLLLTDLMMPGGMTGQELCERLRRERPDLRVVFASGYAVEIPELSEDGATAFLQKPYRPPALANAVRECLDRPRPKPHGN